MGAYKAVLDLGDNEPITLDLCTYRFEKDINEITGNVQSGIRDGILYLGFNHHPSDAIWLWAMKYGRKTGKLQILSISDNKGANIAEEEVMFENASCTNIKVRYNRYGEDHFTTLLTVSAQNIKVGKGNWILYNWKLIES